MLCNKKSHGEKKLEHPDQEYPPLSALETPTCSSEDPVQPKVKKTKIFRKYEVEEQMKTVDRLFVEELRKGIIEN